VALLEGLTVGLEVTGATAACWGPAFVQLQELHVEEL
jgi:hypothetical protein